MVRKDRTFIDAIKNYRQSDIRDDGSLRDSEVENIVYLDKLKQFLVMERDSKKFRVYDSRTGKPKYEHAIPEKPIKGGIMITAEYIDADKVNYIATAQNNKTINFWNADNYAFKEPLNTPAIQTCLKWCGTERDSSGNVVWSVNKLFSAGLDKQIHVYDVTKDRITRIPNNEDSASKRQGGDTYNGKMLHDKAITDLLCIPEQNIIASASLDHKMILWSMKDLKFKSVHEDH